MKYISIPGLQRQCSQIVAGTAGLTPEHKGEVFAMLDAFVEHGGNTLDTSRIYGLGKSETVLAMWLKARNNRNDLVIISKCCHHYIDETGQHHPLLKRVNPECIAKDIRESLDRMQVDYFDICLLHRDDQDVPVGELMDALEEQKESGLIKTYGVSNWTTERIEAAIRHCKTKGYAGLSANSPSLSLALINEPRWVGCVYADKSYAQWHRDMQLPLFSWASQASGFFTGRYLADIISNSDIARVYYNDINWERYRRAQALATKKGDWVKASHIALAYVLNQPFPICAIIGSRTAAEMTDSIKATDIVLTEAERLWLEEAKS